MNPVLRKLLPAFVFLLVLCPDNAFSQDLTGIWKGYFITHSGEHYRLEFQIEQNKGKTVTGYSYSYGSSIMFYGKATMTGHLLDNENFIIQELRTVDVKSASGGTCIMNYKFSFSKSGKEEFLEGSYVARTEDRQNPKNNGVWGNCGGGKVYLRRVEQSDFYVEPSLREKLEKKKNPPVVKTDPPVVKTEKPPVKITPKQENKQTTSVTKTPVVKKPPPKNQTVNNKKDTASKKTEIVVTEKPVIKPKAEIPKTLRSRANELAQTVTVSNEEISVRLYDNGEIDGDTISVYLDGKAIVTNKRLSTTPITVIIKMNEENPEHTLVMVAENLGSIPPNTSLMIVQDGDKRYQVSITSTEQKNAMVRFRYGKK